MDYRYFTLEKRNGASVVYGWCTLPDTAALQMQDFSRHVVASFASEEQARRAYPQAKTILRGKSLLLRPTWPEEQARVAKPWTMSFIYRKKSVASRRRVA
jgi:hypothetical protein